MYTKYFNNSQQSLLLCLGADDWQSDADESESTLSERAYILNSRHVCNKARKIGITVEIIHSKLLEVTTKLNR